MLKFHVVASKLKLSVTQRCRNVQHIAGSFRTHTTTPNTARGNPPEAEEGDFVAWLQYLDRRPEDTPPAPALATPRVFQQPTSTGSPVLLDSP